MANPLTPHELDKIHTIHYEKIRDFLKTGQIVFCSGKYFFSKMIQRLTKSTWSHVAIIYKDDDLKRVMILEAEPFIGIRLVPLSKYVRDYKGSRRPYKGRIFITQLNIPVATDKLNKGISFGLDELTRPYDNWEIFRIMVRILFKKGKRKRNRNYICSELVHDCFAKAGIIFPMNESYISPDIIWKDERVQMKYRVL